MPVYRHLLAALSVGLIGSLAAALAVAGFAVISNAYLSHGFYRTVFYILEGNLSRFVVPAVAGVAALAILTVAWGRIRAGTGNMLAVLLGLASGLAFFLGIAFRYNHSHFFREWLILKRDLFGVRVPEALFQWDVWKPNLTIGLIALAVCLLVWWMARRALPESGGWGRRFWRAVGHPAIAVPVIVIVAGLMLGAGLLREAAGDRPNIILVSLDTLRADHLGCYGYHRDTSPELDRLASEGIVFDWAFCQAPSTERSHMSIFTSLYPTAHGVSLRHRLADRRVTLAEYLRERGYRTAACTDAGYMRRGFGFAQGFERYDDFKMIGLARAVPRVLRWLDEGLASGPFFLVLHTYDIHAPYSPPRPWRDMFTDPEYAGGFNPGAAELTQIRERVKSDPAAGHGLSPEDVEFIVARYDGGVRWADRWMGELVRGLRERDLLETTWLVITSDHGEEFTEHGTVLHGELYHTNTHVPLIVRPPGPSGTGTTVPQIVELIDLMPTFMELAGVAPVETLEGSSLLPLIEGNADGWKNVAFSEQPGKKGWRRAITSAALHVITSFEPGDLEVFDYHNDRFEQVSIADGTRAEEIRDLLMKLDEWTRRQVEISAEHGGPERLEVDAETESQLRSLGYIK